MTFFPNFNAPAGGLLGLLGISSGDPQQHAAITGGLLQAGLNLLNAGGVPAGQAGMQTYGPLGSVVGRQMADAARLGRFDATWAKDQANIDAAYGIVAGAQNPTPPLSIGSLLRFGGS